MNELYELLTELIKLGMPAEDIADKLDLESESVTIEMASTWLVEKYSTTSLVRVVADGGVLRLKR